MSELRTSACARPLIAAYGFFLRHRLPRLARRMLLIALRLEGGDMRSATGRVIMARFHDVEIGAHSYGCFDPERIAPGTRIGRYVSMGPGVRIFRDNHPLGHLSLHPYFYNVALKLATACPVPVAPLSIGHDAWIGANAIILPGCRALGLGAAVGAGSIVTRDVADFAVVAGNPARLLRMRFAECLANCIRASRWWEKTPPELASYMQDLQRPLREAPEWLAAAGRQDGILKPACHDHHARPSGRGGAGPYAHELAGGRGTGRI